MADVERDDQGRVLDKKTGEWVSEKELARRKTHRRVKAAEKVGGTVGKGVGFAASKTFDLAKFAAKKAAPHVKKAASAAKDKVQEAMDKSREDDSRGNDPGATTGSGTGASGS